MSAQMTPSKQPGMATVVGTPAASAFSPPPFRTPASSGGAKRGRSSEKAADDQGAGDDPISRALDSLHLMDSDGVGMSVPPLRINAGGTVFSVSRATLAQCGPCLLTELSLPLLAPEGDNTGGVAQAEPLFLDVDPGLFSLLLRALRARRMAEPLAHAPARTRLGSDCGGIPAPDPSHPPLGVDLEDAWRILTRHLGVDTLLRGGQPCAAAEEAPPRAAALASPCSVGAAKSPTASPPPPPHPAHSSSSAAATAAAAPAAGGPFSVPLTPVRPAAPSSSSPPPPDACAAAPSPSPSWLKRRRVSSAGRCIHSGGGAGRARADKERGPLLVVSLPDGARHTTLLETLRGPGHSPLASLAEDAVAKAGKQAKQAVSSAAGGGADDARGLGANVQDLGLPEIFLDVEPLCFTLLLSHLRLRRMCSAHSRPPLPPEVPPHLTPDWDAMLAHLRLREYVEAARCPVVAVVLARGGLGGLAASAVRLELQREEEGSAEAPVRMDEGKGKAERPKAVSDDEWDEDEDEEEEEGTEGGGMEQGRRKGPQAGVSVEEGDGGHPVVVVTRVRAPYEVPLLPLLPATATYFFKLRVGRRGEGQEGADEPTAHIELRPAGAASQRTGGPSRRPYAQPAQAQQPSRRLPLPYDMPVLVKVDLLRGLLSVREADTLATTTINVAERARLRAEDKFQLVVVLGAGGGAPLLRGVRLQVLAVGREEQWSVWSNRADVDESSRCGSCGVSPIVGRRFSCNGCSVVTCEACERAGRLPRPHVHVLTCHPRPSVRACEAPRRRCGGAAGSVPAYRPGAYRRGGVGIANPYPAASPVGFFLDDLSGEDEEHDGVPPCPQFSS